MRYLPLTADDRSAMLATIGADARSMICSSMCPPKPGSTGPIAGLAACTPAKWRSSAICAALASQNLVAGEVPFFLGAGAYRHHVPASVDHLIQRGEFLTAYTPYQPEIAQGTLQMLFEFQTQVARLLGCDIANASMYDGSTACWEAIGMARSGHQARARLSLLSRAAPALCQRARTMAKVHR